MLQAHPAVITAKEHCINLLIHESSRVFHDRLIDADDRRFFYQSLCEALHSGFKVNWNLDKVENLNIIFGDFVESSALQSCKGSKVYHMMQYHLVMRTLEVRIRNV